MINEELVEIYVDGMTKALLLDGHPLPDEQKLRSRTIRFNTL